jgi:class 3 adenylate cyclase/predicted ATPase
MKFYEVLEQVIELLRREGRVGYRALKRQFDLDDEYIEDLKDELIHVKKVAADEDGRVLVWAGEEKSAPETAAPSPPSAQKSVPGEDQPPPAETRSPQPTVPEAERRQLTVMFCDLVDSTALAAKLDPEDLREIVRSYQEASAEVIERYEGYIAQYLGDGLLVYFGYPRAHEQDAERAVRTGLGIVEAIGTLNTNLGQDRDIELAVRVGVHTGLVVIGEIGGGGRQERLALGETPNIAARLQALAEPNTVLMSEATGRLVGGFFISESLGTHTLKGIDGPISVYRVLEPTGVRSRLEVASPRGLTPLVGRESEVALMRERWSQANGGMGQVVLLSGEAGIGKSHLARVTKDQLTGEPHVSLECRCSPFHENSAWYPVADLWERMLRFERDDSVEDKLRKLETALAPFSLPLEETVPLFAGLLALPLLEDRYPPLTLPPPIQRQKAMEAFLATLLETAEDEPVLLVFEDLHWVDPSTLEFLGLLLDQVPTARILALFTCRPAFQPPWTIRAHMTHLTLSRLPREQAEELVTRKAGGKRLPAELLDRIATETDGVPLFVEELTQSVLESGLLREVNGAFELTGPLTELAIPTTLQDSLMARLDRLGEAKGVAQLAATLGRTFPYELLEAVSESDASRLQRELTALVQAELLYQRGMPPRATYRFKHALIQDVGYQSLLRSSRRQYHQRIAQVLEQQFPETVASQPELVAHHLTEADRNEQAIPYWQRAGQQAMERSAYVEAIPHLSQGLELLKALPDAADRTRQELTLQVALGNAVLATKGFGAPEANPIYARARELCQQLGDTPELFPVLHGLYSFYVSQGDHDTARELVDEFLQVAQGQRDAAPLLIAHRMMGMGLFFRGDVVEARKHFEQCLALYDPHEHHALAFHYSGHDPKVAALAVLALTLWLLGYPDQAVQRVGEALAMARGSSQASSLAYALSQKVILHQFRREGDVVRKYAEELTTLATEHSLALFASTGMTYRGWALAEREPGEEAIGEIRKGLTAWQAMGAEVYGPYVFTLLADAYGKANRTDEGIAAASEALATLERTGERVWESELHRLKGELTLQSGVGSMQSGAQQEAEQCFLRALDVARHRQAKSPELRAATSLSRLWQRQGKGDEAHKLLTEIYGWFTEGFDTEDLKTAKALLEELQA